MANTYLSRSVSTSSNRKTWTWSAWVKKTDITTGYNTLFSSYSDANNYTRIVFWSSTSNQLTVSSKVAGNFPIDYRLTRVSRDTNGWMHIVVALDTTQATDTNRLKIYINGVLETAYEGSAASLPSQDEEPFINRNRVHYIGQTGDSSGYFDGSMSHIHFIDGTAYDASAFGETDTTTGEWKAKTSPSVTYGTNGFFILKDGNGITDQSGEGNDFTLAGGTLTDLKDNPDNTFCTMNSLDNHFQSGTFTNGNNTVQMTNQPAYLTATLGMITGKFYWESKMSAGGSARESDIIGIVPTVTDQTGYNGSIGSANHGIGLRGNGQVWYNNSQPESGWGSWDAGDIVMIALDLDNQKIFWGINGTWGKSSNPATGANGFSISGKEGSLSSGFWFPASCCREIGHTNTWQFNFGNGYFGTTAITTNSGNGYSGAEGSSKFNYTVPTGYSALSTKGLNE